MKIMTALVAFGMGTAIMAGPAAADSLTIRVNPNPERRIIVREHHPRYAYHRDCYEKTVKKVKYNKTVITKTRVCR